MFIQPPAFKEHKTIMRHKMQISSHHLVIFKPWGKFVVAALGSNATVNL
jgi:hypothetical protein